MEGCVGRTAQREEGGREREKEEKGRERKRSNPKRPGEIKLVIRNNKEGRNGGEGWQREREGEMELERKRCKEKYREASFHA